MTKPKKKSKKVRSALGAAGAALVGATGLERAAAASVLGRAGGKASRHLKRIAPSGGRAAWASMNQKERSIEMRRRCVIREANRQARIRAKIEANKSRLSSVAG